MLNAYITVSDFNVNAIRFLEDLGVNVKLRKPGERPKENELIDLVKKYDILIIGAKEKMTKNVYFHSKTLKILGTLSIGTDHMSEHFFKSKKLKIINCPNSNVASTAEHTFALILCLTKMLFEAHQATIDLSGRPGIKGIATDLFGKTLGIVGAGRIGTYVTKLASAFSMNILCYTRNPEMHRNLIEYGVEFKDLSELLSNSDIITIHLPLTQETNNIISEKMIDRIKENAIVINTSRVKLIDNRYLIKKLENKLIKAYAIDIDIEEADLIGQFAGLNNVLMTPHIAGVSIDAMVRMDMELVIALSSILKPLLK